MNEQKALIKYFRSNIYESFASYNAWKMLYLSTSKNVVSKDMAERYVAIQNYHPQFFTLTTRAFLITFVILVLHAFDKTKGAASLYKLNRESTEVFVKENEKILKMLKSVRDKIFAHRSVSVDFNEILLPSVDDLDEFYQNLFSFYNSLTKVENSSTGFGNAVDVKYSIESLFQNLERGESQRLTEINIKYGWESNRNKASDVI